ncbi:hypothetical protein PN36_31630 [Candidatus Thiomargarita nelsonii]|uniref:Uncharacterized protein n=1 Tax=Candidatus Thiomargarita nelsonii TaxID=1003181 RepID=A0A4E0QIW4_9GAMM|nr:hypothetical protein PN36_34010 [Candidatus Thiomargarita nelsonii]TGN99925.1 hypothetical protein PN36_31630 [Candidatus Thiomargarita nelsonii]
MKSIVEIKNKIRQQPEYWQIPFMDFVDDFRRYKDISAIDTPYILDDEKMDALIAFRGKCFCAQKHFPLKRLNTFAMNKA